jgi:hypothetical protein
MTDYLVKNKVYRIKDLINRGMSNEEVLKYLIKNGVDVNNPNQEIIGKMHQIAVSLGAWLQGDEGEFYDKFGYRVITEFQVLGISNWSMRRDHQLNSYFRKPIRSKI